MKAEHFAGCLERVELSTWIRGDGRVWQLASSGRRVARPVIGRLPFLVLDEVAERGYEGSLFTVADAFGGSLPRSCEGGQGDCGGRRRVVCRRTGRAPASRSNSAGSVSLLNGGEGCLLP